MPAYLLAFVTPHKMDWVAEYQAHVPQIIRSHGGKYLALPKYRPNAVELVEGTAPAPGTVVVFTFPSMQAIKAFLDSPEYAPYKAARMAETDSTFYAFENDDDAPQLVEQ